MKRLFLLITLLVSFAASSQIAVNLVRQSDGQIIGTAMLDSMYCTTPDQTPPPQDTAQVDTTTKKLYFEGNGAQFINCNYVFNDTFELNFKTQGVSDVGGWIAFFGGPSVSNRHVLSNSNQRYWANINSGTLSKKSGLNFDLSLNTSTTIYRDTANDIYIQFNNSDPVLCFNSNNAVSFNQICRAYDKYFKGFLLQYSINGELFDLSEQAGDTLTGSSGTIHTISTNIPIDSLWQVPPSAQASVQVYNEGIGGNNTEDLLNRTSDISQHSPDMVFIWAGTNDALNALGNQILPVDQFKDSLQKLVQKVKTENPGVSIALINVIPCTDSILKSNHNYGPHYGPDSTFNLNIDVIPAFNLAVDSVATEEGLPVVDAFTEVSNNIGWIQDGTHINSSGYTGIATLCAPLCTDKLLVVCYGDSHTKGANVSGGLSYPVQLEQLLNQ